MKPAKPQYLIAALILLLAVQAVFGKPPPTRDKSMRVKRVVQLPPLPGLPTPQTAVVGIVQPPPQWVSNRIGAIYAPATNGIQGLSAFVQARTNFGAWSPPVFFAYPTNGGIAWGYWKSPFNALVQFRFGYSVP